MQPDNENRTALESPGRIPMPGDDSAAGGTASTAVPHDGTVTVPSFALPLSRYMSDEARRAFIERAFNPPELRELMSTPDIATLRDGMDRYLFEPMLHKARQRYAVQIRTGSIGGIPISTITPLEGVAPANRHRMLINLHGGFFTVGSGVAGWLESIPVAATLGITVTSIDYRLGPEHVFPAASEDVAAVYRQLLRQYPAANIGMFGSSAGGMLAAMALAWFQKHDLPMPGAVALLSAGATASMGGDAQFLGPAAMGERPTPASASPDVMPVPYLAAAGAEDPLVAPTLDRTILERFPPVLLLTGSRAFDLSAVIHTQRCLRRAGADVDLQLWDGLWHCFFYDVALPESTEVYTSLTHFFDSRLGNVAP